MRELVRVAPRYARRGLPLRDLLEQLDDIAASVLPGLVESLREDPRALAVELRALHELVATMTTEIAAAYAEASV